MSKKLVTLILILILAGGAIYFFTKDSEVIVPPNENNGEIPALPAQEGLPAVVEAKRQAIYKAAIERDYEALGKEAAPDISYSFGAPDENFIEYLKKWDADGKDISLDIIPVLLRLPYEESGGIYAWPYIFYKSPENWTEEDLNVLRTFLSEELIESYQEFGGYYYYRLGITRDGSWIFYIAGD